MSQEAEIPGVEQVIPQAEGCALLGVFFFYQAKVTVPCMPQLLACTDVILNHKLYLHIHEPAEDLLK